MTNAKDSNDAGGVEVIFDVRSLVPHVNTGRRLPLVMGDKDIMPIEAALGRPLNFELREKLRGAIEDFLYSALLKRELPSLRQYKKQLRDRVDAIDHVANNLDAMILPMTEPSVGGTSFSKKELERAIGKGAAARRAATDAAQRTRDDSHVLIAADYIRARIFSLMPEAGQFLRQLGLALHQIRKEIDQEPQNTAGADGHYELNLLFDDLVRVAHDAGDDLNITSHESRANDHGNIGTTPLVAFALAVLQLLRATYPTLIATSHFSDEDKTVASDLLNKQTDKSEGNLLEPLERARLRFEGTSRKDR